MRVFDAHRVLGPVPDDHVTSVDVDGVLADLDRLEIDAAAVTSSAALWGDPREHVVDEALDAAGRLVGIAVVLPGVSGTGAPGAGADLIDAGPAMVRTCPVRHGFDLLGPTALRWWRALAEAAVCLAVDVSETGLPAVANLARAVPELRLLALSPGYRSIRQLSELLEECPAVRIETGTLVAAGAIEWLVRAHGAHRLVFGTGAPLWDDAGPRFQLDHLDLADSDVELIAAQSYVQLTEGRSR